MNRKGFTLLEVLMAVSLLSLFLVSAFLFYSSYSRNIGKYSKNYSLINTVRSFVENFSSTKNSGIHRTEEYELKWRSYPARDPERIIGSTGIRPYCRLKLIRLKVFKNNEEKMIYETDFFYNEFKESR